MKKDKKEDKNNNYDNENALLFLILGDYKFA